MPILTGSWVSAMWRINRVIKARLTSVTGPNPSSRLLSIFVLSIDMKVIHHTSIPYNFWHFLPSQKQESFIIIVAILYIKWQQLFYLCDIMWGHPDRTFQSITVLVSITYRHGLSKNLSWYICAGWLADVWLNPDYLQH